MNIEYIITIVVALASLVGSHQFATWRDRENKRREQRVKYLIDAFRALSKANHHPRLYEIADEIEQAVSDIQFLGNKDQILAAQDFANLLASKKSADLDPVLFALRKELRKELGRQEYSGKLISLRISRSEE